MVAEQARILRQIQERNAAEAASLLLIQQLTIQGGCPPPPRPPAVSILYVGCDRKKVSGRDQSPNF